MLNHMLAQTQLILQPFITLCTLDLMYTWLMCGQVIGQITSARKLFRADMANKVLATANVGNIDMCRKATR